MPCHTLDFVFEKIADAKLGKFSSSKDLQECKKRLEKFRKLHRETLRLNPCLSKFVSCRPATL